jgi:hypothetical protein
MGDARKVQIQKELLREIEELRLRLDEAEQALRGIQSEVTP